MSDCVLDSYALLAFFQNEEGSNIVSDLLLKAENLQLSLHMSSINVGEVFYISARKLGYKKAESILEDTKKLPIKINNILFDDIIEAAKLKSKYSFSFCDAFATWEAKKLGLPLVTGDPEFKHVERIINIEWIKK